MNAIDCAMRMARIIKASSRIKQMMQVHFEAEPTVKLGYAQNMEDWEKDAPFFIFVPNSTRHDPEGEKADVTMFVGLREPAEYDDGGISVLAAYPLMTEALALATSEIAEKVSGIVPTAIVEETVTEYRQENYPLVWAGVEITVNEPMPVGYRRV